MAKEPLIARLHELLTLGAETLATEALAVLNALAPPSEPFIRVALNLADDAHGGWTNRYTTDFANKFEPEALLKRGFCTPLVWASEAFSPELLRRRVLAQAWRSRYRLLHPAPITLAEHLAQEVYVARHLGTAAVPLPPQVHAAYTRLLAASDRPTLLAFFYGDAAATQLGYTPLGGLPPQAGFALAHSLAAG